MSKKLLNRFMCSAVITAVTCVMITGCFNEKNEKTEGAVPSAAQPAVTAQPVQVAAQPAATAQPVQVAAQPAATAQPVQVADQSAAAGAFVSYNEFCKARSLNVITTPTVLLTGNTYCFIDPSVHPTIAMVIRRALKLHNIFVTTDKKSAHYIANVVFEQHLIRNRTTTTMRLTFAENKAGYPPAWTGIVSVSARGSYNAGEYAVSMTGAVLFYFNQYATRLVGRRTLQLFYQRLVAVGD